MKRLWDILVLTLAINFLAVAGGVAYLHQTGRLTPEKVAAFYRDSTNRIGWTLELQAANGVVLCEGSAAREEHNRKCGEQASE